MSCSACASKSPFQIPGYEGFVPGHKAQIGFTYANGTHEAMKDRGPGGAPFKPCPKGCGTMDPCAVRPFKIKETLIHTFGDFQLVI